MDKGSYVRSLRRSNILLGIRHKDGEYLESLLEQLGISYIYCRDLQTLGIKWLDALQFYDTIRQPEFELSEWDIRGRDCISPILNLPRIDTYRDSDITRIQLPNGYRIAPFNGAAVDNDDVPRSLYSWPTIPSGIEAIGWAYERGLLEQFKEESISDYFDGILESEAFWGML